jgi:hypothetical protein
MYKTTTLGSLVYNANIKVMEQALKNYWQFKAIDVIKTQKNFPPQQKNTIINEIIVGSNLKDIVNSTHLSSFNIIKDFDTLVNEILKVLDNAREEVYLASRYYHPYISAKIFDKFSTDHLSLHILDGNAGNVSLENRLNAILRTPPNRQTYEMVSRLIKSPNFELFNLPSLPISFLVVDGNQVIYETINYANPQQFTVAISNYDDTYSATRFIKYFNLLVKDSSRPKILKMARDI